MTYQDIIREVSKKISLPKDIVDKTYKGYWLFIRDYIQNLPLKEDISNKEFNKLRTSINVPSLGKLYVKGTFNDIKKNYKGVVNGKVYKETCDN